MGRELTFATGTIVTAQFLNDRQDVESALALGVRLEKASNTVLRVPVATDGSSTGQTSLQITANTGGAANMRFITAPVTLDLTGMASGTYDIYATAGAGPAFGLQAVTSGGAAPANARKIGEADWSGSAITAIRNKVDAVSGHNFLHLPDNADGLAVAAPTTALGNGVPNAVGAANSFARSDHTHAIAARGITSNELAFVLQIGGGQGTTQTPLTVAGVLNQTGELTRWVDNGAVLRSSVAADGHHSVVGAAGVMGLNGGVAGQQGDKLALYSDGASNATRVAIGVQSSRLVLAVGNTGLSVRAAAATAAATSGSDVFTVSSTGNVAVTGTLTVTGASTMAAVTGTTINATTGLQVGGVALAASHLSNGTTGTGAVVLASSPTLTGTPLAVTAAADTNTTQIATTAFVVGQASSVAPSMDGAAAVGTSLRYARADHVHPVDTSRQPLDSTLTALAAYNSNGLVTQTAADTFAGRTIVGTANRVTVTNGDGVAGNPTLSLPQDIHTGAAPTFASLTLSSGALTALNLSSTGISTGITIGGDVNVYRGGADWLRSDDFVTSGKGLRATTGSIPAAAQLGGGIEMTYSGTQGNIVVYDYTTPGYKPLQVDVLSGLLTGTGTGRIGWDANGVGFFNKASTPFARPAARTVTNWTNAANRDVSIDRNSFSIGELFDFVMSLHYDLQQYGLFA